MTVLELYADEVATTLSTPVTPTDIHLPVTSMVGFPNPVSGVSQFRARLRKPIEDGTHEYVLITAVSGGSYTCVRGIEGSTAQTWSAGSVMEPVLTATQVAGLARLDMANVSPSSVSALLGTAATHAATDFDPAGAAATAHDNAVATAASDATFKVASEATARATAISTAIAAEVVRADSAYDHAGAANGIQAAAVASAKSYTDAQITSEITRANGAYDAAGAASAAAAAVSASISSSLAAKAAIDLSNVNAATGRTALGLGNSATRAVGTTTGTVAAGDDSRFTSLAASIAGAATKAANLSDLASAPTARTNLGLLAIAASGSADDLADGTTKKAFLATERTKLAGVATGATANSSDATLLARANHTGTETSSVISDFAEAVQDVVAALLVQGTGISLVYNDAGNSLTITATGGGGGLDTEAVQDVVGAMTSGTGLISAVYNDAANTLTISTTATANSTDAALRDRSTHTGTESADVIVDGTTNKAYTAAEKTKLAAISGTNTGDQTSVSGNAGTATKLQTARQINGVAFDGTANITVADATKVALTGDQSVFGIKSFASPPSVPAPLVDNDVANKLYVDTGIDTAVPVGSFPVFLVDPATHDDSNLAAALSAAPAGATLVAVKVAGS